MGAVFNWLSSAPLYLSCKQTAQTILASPRVSRVKELAHAIFSQFSSWFQAFHHPAIDRDIKSFGMNAVIYLLVFLVVTPLIVRHWRRPSAPGPNSPRDPTP